MHFFNLLLLAGRFSIGCGSEFRVEVAYLEVGSSDLERIHEKKLMKFMSKPKYAINLYI